MSQRVFVGFGFGAIQAGLFLLEAHRSGGFSRLVVAHRRPDVIRAVHAAGGHITVNIAHTDRVERVCFGPIEMYDVNDAADQKALVAAVAAASELATALPSVSSYVSDHPGSVHRLLAAGFCQKLEHKGPPAVVYAAENHNHAAEMLNRTVLAEIPPHQQGVLETQVQMLNTVIGKMSSSVTDPAEMQTRGLSPVAPGLDRAFVVEAFNRILVSSITLSGFRRGLGVFEEKTDLLPFEEAKLYGHNATHALAAYLGKVAGVDTIAALRDTALPFLRAAFLDESGGTLRYRHHGVDPLFSKAGYRAYADDLLARMMNPQLGDSVARVGRDPERKLGWDDRLIGTIRLAQAAAITPRRYALGTAAALATLHPEATRQTPLWPLLHPLWPDVTEGDAQGVLGLLESAWQQLKRWQVEGEGGLEALLDGC